MGVWVNSQYQLVFSIVIRMLIVTILLFIRCTKGLYMRKDEKDDFNIDIVSLYEDQKFRDDSMFLPEHISSTRERKKVLKEHDLASIMLSNYEEMYDENAIKHKEEDEEAEEESGNEHPGSEREESGSEEESGSDSDSGSGSDSDSDSSDDSDSDSEDEGDQSDDEYEDYE